MNQQNFDHKNSVSIFPDTGLTRLSWRRFPTRVATSAPAGGRGLVRHGRGHGRGHGAQLGDVGLLRVPRWGSMSSAHVQTAILGLKHIDF